MQVPVRKPQRKGLGQMDAQNPKDYRQTGRATCNKILENVNFEKDDL